MPEVVTRTFRMLRVDQRQRDERPAVLRPAGQHRQAIEPHIRRHHIGDRPARAARGADAEGLAADVARGPQLRGRGRQQGFGEVDEAFDQALRARAERELGAARGAEQIGHERERRALDVREQQRGPARRNHPAVDFGDFEIGVDGRVDRDEVAIAAQTIEKRAEIGKRRIGHEP